MEFDQRTADRLEAMYTTGDAERRRRLARSHLGAGPGERVLDVGCGPGFFCAELSEEVGTTGGVVGVDPSPAMLELATRRCGHLGNVELRAGDACSVPVDDGTFDAALSVQVLEYVEDIRKALAELRRALRPGGRVALWDVDWSTASWHSEDPARMARVLEAWDEHLYDPCLPRTLGPALVTAGFDDVEMHAHGFATNSYSEACYGVSLIPLIGSFVAGRGLVDRGEARAWADEQAELGRQGRFYFACMQFCFTAAKPA
ncbi:MAG TPA: methyltransferase domain-containing protein [Acidimicrobiales bacterium]|nr:methyltransferase domain-containing protein [Acidimicrobiales bacterium]